MLLRNHRTFNSTDTGPLEMNLTRQLMATTEDFGAAISAMSVQHGLESRSRRDELHTLMDDYYQAGTLMSALEGISAGGLVSNGTNRLLFLELDRLNVQIDGKGLESVTDPEQLHQAGMEGLGHLVNRLKDRLNNWSDRNKLENEGATGRVVASGERLLGELAKVKVKLQALDNGASADVKLDSLDTMLNAGGKSFPNDPAKWIYDTMTAAINLRVDFEKRTDALAGKFQAALGDLDMSSDASFKKTWLSKAGQFEPLFLKKLPPNTDFTPGAENRLYDKGAVDAWKQYVGGNVDDRDVLRVPIYGFESFRATKAEGSKTVKVKVSDVIRLIDQAMDLLKKHTTVTQIRQTNKIAGKTEDLLIMAYLIETQRGIKNPKHINNTSHNMRPGSLQMLAGPMNWYVSDGLYQLTYSLLFGANAAVQLGRRLATAVKQ